MLPAVWWTLASDENMSDDIYREAFLSGINNENISTPATLEDAVQAAIEACGEYGEGLSVADWTAAQLRYRTDRGSAPDDAGSRRKAAKIGNGEPLRLEAAGIGARS
ncbi:unnamed protein product [Phytophthora fragariaefolia]|uniref:Unnamed protein product n=1 Tax=Phytophthora fragariaefolia TaxID=1490495 RepID=A0A9W6YH12_9STRA|nr:unnamed protein product [Phytophthora fragariaefolia]